MNIRIKYTNQITKNKEKTTKKWQKSVILGQFLAFVTLTLTFKRLFLDISSLFLNNVVLCKIFPKRKTDDNLNKEIAYKIL